MSLQKPLPNLPLEIKAHIIDLLAEDITEENPDVFSSIALVWKDVAHPIRRHRFNYIYIDAVGIAFEYGTLRGILDILCGAPYIANAVRSIQIVKSDDDSDNDESESEGEGDKPDNKGNDFENTEDEDDQDPYAHPYLPYLLAKCTRLEFVSIKNFRPSLYADASLAQLYGSFGSSATLTTLDLEGFMGRTISELWQLLSSFPHLNEIQALKCFWFKDLELLATVTGHISTINMSTPAVVELVSRGIGPLPNVKKLDIMGQDDSVSSTLFADLLGSSRTIFPCLEELSFRYSYGPSMKLARILDRLRASLRVLDVACTTSYIMDPTLFLPLPPSLEFLKIEVPLDPYSPAEVKAEIGIYARSLQRLATRTGAGLAKVVIHLGIVCVLEDEGKDLAAMEGVSLLDEVLSSEALGVKVLVLVVDLQDTEPETLQSQRRSFLKSTFPIAFPNVNTKFFGETGNGVTGKYVWDDGMYSVL